MRYRRISIPGVIRRPQPGLPKALNGFMYLGIREPCEVTFYPNGTKFEATMREILRKTTIQLSAYLSSGRE